MTNELARIRIIDLQAEPEERDPDSAPIMDANGIPHWYADPDEPTLRERSVFTKLVNKITSLEKINSPSEKQDEDYKAAQIDALHYALPTVDLDVFAGLKPGERSALLLGFLVHSGNESAMGKATSEMLKRAAALSRSTGENSSPSSNGSTAVPA